MADRPGHTTTLPTAGEGEGPSLPLVLTLVYPLELAGRTLPLRPGLVLGRAVSGEGRIDHATVSRQHAGLVAGMGGILYVKDLESRNGTAVDGRRRSLPQPLSLQSVLRLGDVLGVVREVDDTRFEADPAIPGTGPRVARARESLQRAAREPAGLLITGETGTGKERLAVEAHRRSGRAGPFVAFNCAELSLHLVESQLFGHERGAFTGATTAKPGLFAAADGGTLFLDEVGELPLELQPKLLRVLQEGEVRPVGSLRARRVDVRVVAATHRDLLAMVEAGQFRRDLYARLALWEVALPALRQRKQDLFAWLAWLGDGRSPPSLSADAAERVLTSAWLDNLRGLQRMLHRLAACHEHPIRLRTLLESLPELALPEPNGAPEPSAEPVFGTTPPPSSGPPAAPSRARPSREELLAVYQEANESVRATAKHFGKDRRQIYRWLDLYAIPRDPKRDD